MIYQKDSLLEDHEICTEFEMKILSPFGIVFFCTLMLLNYCMHVAFESVFVPTLKFVAEIAFDLVIGTLDPDSEEVNFQFILEEDYYNQKAEEQWKALGGEDGINYN
jgi:hypothetical protein